MAPANSLARNEDLIEIERKMVPERYMDIITYEFAYDPVKLPLDQDPTQSLYNRKTLETIWETKCQAENPFTKQWFNAKSVIPQVELRQEMEDYIKLQKFSDCKLSEIDVIEEYTKVLEEGDMKQYLDVLKKTFSENLTTNIQCSAMWKKINLLRMYCQFHCKNIETFRSLHGFRCLNELIIEIRMVLLNNSIEDDMKEVVWDVCKEIAMAIDVIGLKPLDIYDIEKPREGLLIRGYVRIIDIVYRHNESYVKIYSLMLKMFCKIFYEMGAQIEKTLGKELYQTIIAVMGLVIVTRKLSQTNAKDISSEDLNHAISILRRSWITTTCFTNPIHSQMLVNAIIICIVREIHKSEEMKDLGEAQLLEAEAEARHNCEALELGLSLVKDILMTEGISAAHILGGSLNIAEEIKRMFEQFTRQDENEDETSCPVICVKKGCKIFECFHSRIAQLGLDICAAIWRMGGPSLDNEVLLQFVKAESAIPC